MTSYEHKVKNIYLWSPYNEWQPLIPGDYTLLRWPCDEGFHVPLKEEWDAIINAGVTYSQFKTKLYICNTGGARAWDGTWGSTNSTRLLSSTTLERNVTVLYLDGASVDTYSGVTRSQGHPVRWFRDTPIIPDSDWTETFTWKIWHNSELWLISVLVGTNQYVTLQDKNLGATEVYQGTLNENNRWKFYQRWNNYGFTWNSSGDTSSTKVDASNYWPSNPYSSSTFITTSSNPYDRSSVQNDNLRWYTDFNS